MQFCLSLSVRKKRERKKTEREREGGIERKRERQMGRDREGSNTFPRMSNIQSWFIQYYLFQLTLFTEIRTLDLT